MLDQLKRLEEIITGQLDDEAGKRHAVILGGPCIGKQALLDQIYCRARQPGCGHRGRRSRNSTTSH